MCHGFLNLSLLLQDEIDLLNQLFNKCDDEIKLDIFEIINSVAESINPDHIETIKPILTVQEGLSRRAHQLLEKAYIQGKLPDMF